MDATVPAMCRPVFADSIVTQCCSLEQALHRKSNCSVADDMRKRNPSASSSRFLASIRGKTRPPQYRQNTFLPGEREGCINEQVNWPARAHLFPGSLKSCSLVKPVPTVTGSLSSAPRRSEQGIRRASEKGESECTVPLPHECGIRSGIFGSRVYAAAPSRCCCKTSSPP